MILSTPFLLPAMASCIGDLGSDVESFADDEESALTVPSGVYQLRAFGSGECVAISGDATTRSAPLVRTACEGPASPRQRWELTHESGDRYVLKNLNSGLCSDVQRASSDDGAAVQQWTCHDRANQRWDVLSAGDDTFQIKAAHSGKCLDAGAGALTQSACTNTAKHRFRLVRVDAPVNLPARIQAEDFVRFEDQDDAHRGDCGSGPVDQDKTSDSAGICNIGGTRSGEWLEYDVHAARAGEFDLVLRVASARGDKRAHVEVDGRSVGTITAPNRGWQTFEDRRISRVRLDAGNHRLRVVFDTGDVNLNYIDVRGNAAVESGLDARPNNPSCVAPPRATTSVEVQRAFGALRFSKPVGMLQAPGQSEFWYVIEQGGRVLRFPNRADVAQSDVQVVLDIRSRVNAGPYEAGLLGLAFHPRFPENRSVYLSYTYGDRLRSRIARYQSNDGGRTFDPSSERSLLEVAQPANNHNGGQISFGPDGYLYIALGDGGSSNDPNNHGQDTETLLGSVLRIDVDSGSPYGVPRDNPFVSGGGRPEIYAWGFRNPWRFSFDRATGQLWLADVGQDRWEEIDIVEKGKNYGWKIREGAHCRTGSSCRTDGLTDPVYEYGHDRGESITGGVVYRGTNLPALSGTYVYGDFASGRIWGLKRRPDGRFENADLASTSLKISSFAEGLDGELYALDWDGGGVHRLAAGRRTGAGGPPARLSETGCVDPRDPTRMAGGVIPYDVALPFWSDNAEKSRHLALPNGAKLRVGADGDWELPPGGVLIKNFTLGGRRIESRFYVRHDDGSYSGYTYEWNDAQTDAQLLTEGKRRRIDGQEWLFPSSGQCVQCHTQAAGHSLALETRQLNISMRYPSTGRTANQLSTLEHIGMVDPVARQPQLPAIADGSRSLEERARAYLHVNCSNCHRPGGGGRGGFDLRLGASLRDTKICNKTPELGDLGVANAKLLTPGDHARSLIWMRANRRDDEQMPPLASSIVDRSGTELLADWIDAVTRCP